MGQQSGRGYDPSSLIRAIRDACSVNTWGLVEVVLQRRPTDAGDRSSNSASLEASSGGTANIARLRVDLRSRDLPPGAAPTSPCGIRRSARPPRSQVPHGETHHWRHDGSMHTRGGSEQTLTTRAYKVLNRKDGN